MQITVSGKQIDVGDALKTHVEDRLLSAVAKYFDRPANANVVFSKNAHNFRCDSTVRLATGLTANAQAQATDIYSAFDQASDRIEKQIRRYKRRLKNHHQARQDPIEMISAPSYVIANQEESQHDEDETQIQPVIIAEMTTDIKALTVGEAVMQMELDNTPFLIFVNQANGRMNVVFQRDDGNVGWVDPGDQAKSA